MKVVKTLGRIWAVISAIGFLLSLALAAPPGISVWFGILIIVGGVFVIAPDYYKEYDMSYDYDFTRNLDDAITPPAYDPKKWPSKEDWRLDVIEQGYYWVFDKEDGWDEYRQIYVGVPCICSWVGFRRVAIDIDCVVHGTSVEATTKRQELDKAR